jgi:molybdopterin-containing oxidoreductase family membrane subunit
MKMGVSKKVSLTVFGLIMAAGAVMWLIQLWRGLILTDMNNAYSWGLYVSALAFFVGNAAGGLVLSSMIYLFGVTALKPFARIGALCAFANVAAAMLIVLPDLGRPFRVLNLLLHPQIMSPLVWDVIVLNLYAGLSLIYLYLLMLPDLAARTGFLNKIALPVPDPAGFSDRWAKRLAPFSLVAAVGIHVVTAWIFATQGARGWWHTAVMAPDFVAAALASGTAVVMLVAVLCYGTADKLQSAFRIMVIFIATSFFIHIFLMYNDFVIHAWYGSDHAKETLAITLQEYGLAHAFEVLAPLAGVLLLLNARVRQTMSGIMAGCLLIIAGIFVHRILLMPAAFNQMPLTLAPLGSQHTLWSVPIASGRYVPPEDTFVSHHSYFPTLVEILIFAGVLSFVCALILVAVHKLPVVKEG